MLETQESVLVAACDKSDICSGYGSGLQHPLGFYNGMENSLQSLGSFALFIIVRSSLWSSVVLEQTKIVTRSLLP